MATDKTLLVTGSSGLIGSEVVDYFCLLGWTVHGIDNTMRTHFFGPQGDTHWNQRRLGELHATFRHHELDICDRGAVLTCLEQRKPSAIVHAAAQPTHDLAASRPFDDFDVNAVGTLNTLDAIIDPTRAEALLARPLAFANSNPKYIRARAIRPMPQMTDSFPGAYHAF